jgi:hypothetical protein
VLDAARLQVNCEGAVIVFCGASRRSSRGDTCHALLPGSVDFGTGLRQYQWDKLLICVDPSPLPWLFAKHALVSCCCC